MYFHHTEAIAGIRDARFQTMMPDVLNWLGVKHIDTLVSMSNMKYDAIVSQGITVGERLAIPDEQIPDDAKVEMEPKKAAGYFTHASLDPDALKSTVGRNLEQF